VWEAVDIPLDILATCAVLIALSFAYRSSIGALLEILAKAFKAASWKVPYVGTVGLGFLAGPIESVDNSIRDALAAGISSTEWAWHVFLGQITGAWQWIGRTVDEVATDTAGALKHLVKETVPAIVAGLLVGPTLLLKTLGVTVGQLERDVKQALAASGKTIVKVEHVAVGTAAAVPKIVTVTIPAAVKTAVALPSDITRGIDETLKATKEKLDKLARTLTPAGILGLTAAAVLSGLGLGWLKCSNVNKVGKRLCGLNANTIEQLLAGLVVVFGTLDLVKFSKQVQGVTDEFEGVARDFWRVTEKGPIVTREFGTTGL